MTVVAVPAVAGLKQTVPVVAVLTAIRSKRTNVWVVTAEAVICINPLLIVVSPTSSIPRWDGRRHLSLSDIDLALIAPTSVTAERGVPSIFLFFVRRMLFS